MFEKYVEINNNLIDVEDAVVIAEGSISQLSYVENNLVYSSNEINTGRTWFNGKTIYRKVFQTSAINSTQIIVNHNISNADIVWVDISCSFLLSGTNTYSLPRLGNNLTQCVGVQATRTYFTLSPGSDANFDKAIVTLLYTKR